MQYYHSFRSHIVANARLLDTGVLLKTTLLVPRQKLIAVLHPNLVVQRATLQNTMWSRKVIEVEKVAERVIRVHAKSSPIPMTDTSERKVCPILVHELTNRHTLGEVICFANKILFKSPTSHAIELLVVGGDIVRGFILAIDWLNQSLYGRSSEDTTKSTVRKGKGNLSWIGEPASGNNVVVRNGVVFAKRLQHAIHIDKRIIVNNH